MNNKKQIITIKEALEKFSLNLTSDKTASKVEEMLQENSNGRDSEVTITVKIRSDFKTPNPAVASIDIRLSRRVISEQFCGLV